jgi:hypothetical protein
MFRSRTRVRKRAHSQKHWLRKLQRLFFGSATHTYFFFQSTPYTTAHRLLSSCSHVF